MDIRFTHERLEAYQVAREFLRLAHGIRVHGDLREQLTTAAESVMLNTAEGAGRRGGRDKAKFYDYAHASAEECAAILDAVEIRGGAAADRLEAGRRLLERVVRLLWGLSRSARRRA